MPVVANFDALNEHLVKACIKRRSTVLRGHAGTIGMRLAADLEAATHEKPLIHPAIAVAYRQRVAALAQALYDEEFGRQAFERLRAVVEAVVLTPVDGQLTIELRGALTGILRVAEKEVQHVDIAQKNALQIKMVAGAGFEPKRPLYERFREVHL